MKALTLRAHKLQWASLE